MTEEFDPTPGGFAPGSPEAFQADELNKETEEREQGDRNEAAGLNRDGSPKAVPPVAPTPSARVNAAPAVKPKIDLAAVRAEKIPFVKDAQSGDIGLTEEQAFIKHKLAGEQKFAFYVPLDPGEKKGAVRPVIINGYRCEVPKGMQVQLPYSIYQLLMQAYDAEADVLTSHESNLNHAGSDVRKALGME